MVIVYLGKMRRTFRGGAVEVALEESVTALRRRVPGAMAALHQDRATFRLPRRMRLQADDGVDRVVLDFEATSAAQLVAADPALPGYGFINELPGTFTSTIRLGRVEAASNGLGMLEYVA